MQNTPQAPPTRPLPAPAEARRRVPASPRAVACARAARHSIRDLLSGRDPRLLVVVGPCSIHDPVAALDYARRLARVAAATRDALFLVMRTYFEKPRTRVGWPGLMKDPDLDGSGDAARGIALARRLLVAINELGVPCGSELVDPSTHHYLDDLLAWAAIGARTSESQIHREMASGLPLPVGFKNGTDGRLDVALNGVLAARQPHHAIGLDAEGELVVRRTAGNPDAHLVLRGGDSGPNYSRDVVARAAGHPAVLPLQRPVLVDCSHGNSGRDPARQPDVLADVIRQVQSGQEGLLGVMLESHVRPGRQDWRPDRPLAYGVSITDACLGWEETEALLFDAAAAVGTLLPAAGVGPVSAARAY